MHAHDGACGRKGLNGFWCLEPGMSKSRCMTMCGHVGGKDNGWVIVGVRPQIGEARVCVGK